MSSRHALKKQRSAPKGHTVLVATNADFAKVCARTLNRLPKQSRVKLVTFTRKAEVHVPATRAGSTVIVSRLSDIALPIRRRSRVASSSKHLLFLEDLPAEAMASRLPRLNIRNPGRLHITTRSGTAAIAGLIERLVSGLAAAGEAQIIVDAWIENEQLCLLSPNFVRLEVPLQTLTRLIGADRSRVRSFQIDDDGRYLHWPHADAHLGWEQLQQLVEPTSALAAAQRSKKFNERYGAAIRSLREERRLKQSEISGITERHLRRIEHGEQAASKAVLEALATASSMSLAEYLDALAERTRING